MMVKLWRALLHIPVKPHPWCNSPPKQDVYYQQRRMGDGFQSCFTETKMRSHWRQFRHAAGPLPETPEQPIPPADPGNPIPVPPEMPPPDPTGPEVSPPIPIKPPIPPAPLT